MKRIKLGISVICICFLLCGCEDIPNIIRGRESQVSNDGNPNSVDDTIEKEKVDSVDFVNWINSFEIQPIDYVSVSLVIENDGKCIVYTHKQNTHPRENHRAGFITIADIILYDGLKIYSNDFIMVGNCNDPRYGGTIPVYVRKSEMLENWQSSYFVLDSWKQFNIHWTGEILKKRMEKKRNLLEK